MTFSDQIRLKLMSAGLNMIQQALSIFDSDLRLALCSRRYGEMFDLPEHLVQPGVSFEDTIRFLVHRGEYGPVDDPEEAVKLRVRTARAFQPHYMERQRANGRWISVEGAPLPQGGWVTVYTDITEVKLQEGLLRARSEELSGELLTHAERLAQANRALAASNAALEQAKRELTEMEARTRLTTEMMPAHIAHMDRGLRYTFSNRRLAAIFPGLPQNIVGRTARDVLGPVFDKIAPLLDRALMGENAVQEFTHDESGRRIRLALTPDRVGDGPINGIYIMSMDVTQETQARAALAQTHKRELAAQLSSGMVHDFGNLLTIILGLQGQILKDPTLPAHLVASVKSTIAAARRGGVLLERLASISGHREVRLRPTDLAEILHDLAAMARPTLPARVTLSIHLPPDLPQVLLDQGVLQDSLLNLILNARDAIGDSRGTITLTLAKVADTWLELRLHDSGPGFSPQALAHGLDPFFTTKGAAGSGLGLAMVYDQITLSGGTVRLSNAAQGGALVTLRLPYRPVPMTSTPPIPAAAASAPDGRTVPGRGPGCGQAQGQAHGQAQGQAQGQGEAQGPGIALLVEDTDSIREQVRVMLCDLRLAVIEAASGEEALALADLAGLSLVLSDINLPGANSGLDLARRLRKAGMTRIQLMTALPAQHPLYREAASEFPVLRKPFALSDLRLALDNLPASPAQVDRAQGDWARGNQAQPDQAGPEAAPAPEPASDPRADQRPEDQRPEDQP